MPRRLPPLNALRAFEAAARHLSFSKAAEELHVTPAAISHQVKALEELLGVALFRRLPRGLMLTGPGLAYLPGLSRGFDHLATATDQLRAEGARGRLTVSLLPSLAACWLVPRLADFHAKYPEVDLNVQAEVRAVNFGTEDVDLAIRYGLGHYPGLESQLLMREEIFPVCSPALLNGPHPLRRMADLRHHTLLHDSGALHTEPSVLWPTWLREAGVTDVDVERGPRFNDTTMILQAAVNGQGVALGRTGLLADFLGSGRLVRPFDVTRPADFSYYIVVPPHASGQPKVQAFVQWLLDQAEQHALAMAQAPKLARVG